MQEFIVDGKFKHLTQAESDALVALIMANYPYDLEKGLNRDYWLIQDMNSDPCFVGFALNEEHKQAMIKRHEEQTGHHTFWIKTIRLSATKKGEL